MYTHLLVPTDGSPLSDHALDQALALARALGARVTLFTVVEPFHAIAYTPEQVVESASSYEAHARAAADRRLRDGACGDRRHLQNFIGHRPGAGVAAEGVAVEPVD